jgi:hypothetical protein
MVKTNTIDPEIRHHVDEVARDAHSFISMISVIAKMSMIKTTIRYRMHIMERPATFLAKGNRTDWRLLRVRASSILQRMLARKTSFYGVEKTSMVRT